ncbi:hypothetical protein HanIR_Chr11g0545611 [Helianthus annuus]|nr:hypothetical protein HanIR_Chr11g0545611 [Helianthus annuus]
MTKRNPSAKPSVESFRQTMSFVVGKISTSVSSINTHQPFSLVGKISTSVSSINTHQPFSFVGKISTSVSSTSHQ